MGSLTFLSIGFSSSTLGMIANIIIGVLGFVISFGMAVFIHELGHFLAAKAFRVPVERFVIGMDKEAMGFLPRCIWERKIGETVYGVSLIAIGGYVKMAGTIHPDIERYLDGDTPAKEGDAKSEEAAKAASLQEQALGDMAALYKRPFWQKVIIYGAGVFMNLVLAMALITFIFAKGYKDNAPFEARIAWIAPDSTFAGTGLGFRDHILSVNGHPVKDSDEFGLEIFKAQESNKAAPLSIELKRDGNADAVGSTYTFETTWQAKNDKWLEDFANAFQWRDAYIDFVNFNTPAAKAGFRHADIVVSIDGEKVLDWAQFRTIISKAPGKELSVVVQRGTSLETLKVTPWKDADNPERGQIGVVPGNPLKVTIREGFFEAVRNAPGRILFRTEMYAANLGKLGKRATQGNITAVRRELGGPVGIAQIAYKLAQESFDDWLQFVIGFNVALAVMNLIPFPILDGGHIFFAIYEAIFRRPVPPKLLVPIMNGAVIFIIVFFVLVTFNDVLKLFS